MKMFRDIGSCLVNSLYMRLVLSVETVKPQKHDFNYADTTKGEKQWTRINLPVHVDCSFPSTPRSAICPEISFAIFSVVPLVVKFFLRSFYVILISQRCSSELIEKFNGMCVALTGKNKAFCQPWEDGWRTLIEMNRWVLRQINSFSPSLTLPN